MKQKSSHIIKYALASVAAGVLLWLALRNVNWSLIAKGLTQCRWEFILLMVLANLASLCLRALRWGLLTAPVAPDARRTTVFNAYCIGNFFNTLLPGSGEFIRCGFLRTGESSYQKVLGTVITERIWDVISIAVLTLIALLAGSGEFSSFCRENIWSPLSATLAARWWIIPSAAVLLLLLVAAVKGLKKRFPVLRRADGFFKGIWEGFLSFRLMRRKGLFLLLTVGVWVLYWFAMHCVLWAMPEISHLRGADSLMLTALGNLASVIPAPGSIGAYHFLIASAISQVYSASWETGLLYAVLNHEPVLIFHLMMGAACYFLERTASKRAGQAGAQNRSRSSVGIGDRESH